MESLERIQERLSYSKRSLERAEAELRIDPDNLFYRGVYIGAKDRVEIFTKALEDGIKGHEYKQP